MKITFPQLINLLSLSSGKPRQQCEDFLKEFFRLAVEVIESGENVKIKGFGTFKLIEVSARKSVNVSNGEEYEIPAHSKIAFVASRELAALVNQPFEAFEAVEISDESLEEWKEMDNAEEQAENNDGEVEIGEDSLYLYDDTDTQSDPGSHDENEEIPEDELPEDGEEDDNNLIYNTESADSGYNTESGYNIETVTEQNADDFSVISLDTEAEDNSGSGNESDENTATDNESQKKYQPYSAYVESYERLIVGNSEQPSDEDNEATDNQDDENDGLENIEETEYPSKHSKKSHYKFAWGFFAGFVACVAVVAIVLIMLGYMMDFSRLGIGKSTDEKQEISIALDSTDTDAKASEPTESENNDGKLQIAQEEKTQEENPVATEPSDKPVYDTVTTTRYLTTIAKEHYGNYNLWPYIYEENKDILGHPDRIRPGTKVVVPSLGKYGVDSKNPKDIEVAKKKGIEIYGRYKK